MLSDVKKLNVLDTFSFKNSKLFLKEFHIERSFEALQIIESSIAFDQIKLIYDNVEKKYLPFATELNMFRLIFKNNSLQDYEVQIKDRAIFSDPILLQLVHAPTKRPGLGPQNYKWEQRDFWTKQMQNKRPEADDVICVNAANMLTETSFFNLFLYDPTQDLVLTPSLQSGCINGVYRRFIIKNKKIDLPDLGLKAVIETNIDYKKIATFKIYVANSVREILKAKIL